VEKYMNDIWQKTLHIIRQALTEVSFDIWIKGIRPISIKDNVFYLCVPNEFTRSILDSRYIGLVSNAIKQISQKTFDIKFILPSDIEKHALKLPETLPNEAYQNTLNPKYTFDTFVIGNGNQFAHAACLAVSESPAKAYNPLFMYGGVGLGKTHLMHAIGHYILSKNPMSKVLYVSSEKFTNELINSIRDDKNVEFRNRYRTIDVLLIDDIQFIAGKERTQEEFFHTFNSLHETAKQIIISSDRPPKEIPTLEDRLRSRFEWGLTADIQPPDLETRIAILKKKAELENAEVEDDVLLFIARRIESNIRELEGALIRIVAYSSLTNNNLSVETAEEVLKDLISENSPQKITVQLIQKVVADYFEIKTEEFKSKKRNRPISHPRQIAMYLCRELTDLSLPKIGDEFGGRDHTTVIHACEKVKHDIEAEINMKKTVAELTKNIKGD